MNKRTDEQLLAMIKARLEILRFEAQWYKDHTGITDGERLYWAQRVQELNEEIDLLKGVLWEQ